MRGRLFHKERPWLVFALIFALVLLRFCYYGFTYYPQLDDYIQLHNQSAYYSAKAVILDMGLLSSRPLASVMDYFFWSHFWPFLMPRWPSSPPCTPPRPACSAGCGGSISAPGMCSW